MYALHADARGFGEEQCGRFTRCSKNPRIRTTNDASRDSETFPPCASRACAGRRSRGFDCARGRICACDYHVSTCRWTHADMRDDYTTCAMTTAMTLQRGTVSSNSRFQTVPFQQYSANPSAEIDAPGARRRRTRTFCKSF